MKHTSDPAPANPSHRAYYRPPARWRLPPPAPLRRSKAAKRRAPRKDYGVSLVVVAELLDCNASSPYAAVARFGLALWVRSRLREQLTRGARYAFDAQLERTVKFNAHELERHARFVLAVRGDHQGSRVDGVALASALGVTAHPDALPVWLSLVACIAGELLDAIEYSHLEDMPWAKAERYLDLAVVPRVRKLSTTDPTAEPPAPNPYGGYRRVKRVLDGITSDDPDVVKRTLQGSDFARVRFGQIPDPTGWESWPDGAVADHAADKTA